MTACLLALALAASPAKLAVLQVHGGEGVPQSTAAAITEAVVAEVRRQSGVEVITQREIASILSLEKQRSMLGCETDACMAELGGALGADRLVAGDIAKLGESFLMHLRVVDVKKVRVAAQADRRLRGGTIDDVLDVLPAMVAELFPGAPGAQPVGGAIQATPPAQPGPAKVPQPPPALADVPRPGPYAPAPPYTPAPGAAPAPQVSATGTAPSAWVEERDALPRAVRDRLYVLTDDEGLYIALVPFQGIDTPFYAGDGKKMYRQRIVGGGQEGRLAFDRVFWEPRARAGAQSQLEMRGGKATLFCGKTKTALRVLGDGGARRIVSGAEFLAAPFRRVPHLLARDDQGAYFLVDAARDPETGGPADRPDYRLRYGRKGGLAPVALTDAIADPGGLVLVSSSGRFVDQGGAAEWIAGPGRTPLKTLDVADAAPFVYGELGAYGARLGTPCDGKF